ncbi:MAG: AAA family ATPase, partial [bacterium]
RDEIFKSIMAIKKIRLTNFKSFKDVDIELGNFNILIGANASGKSNFIQIFKFLRSIPIWGLDDAISGQGGIEYFRNINIGSSEGFSLEAVSDRELTMLGPKTKEKGQIGIKTYEIIYNLALGFEDKSFEITNDELKFKCEFVRLEKKKGEIKESNMLGKGEMSFYRAGEEVDVNLKLPNGLSIKKDDILTPFLRELNPKMSLLCHPVSTIRQPYLFGEISMYDFDPKKAKQANPIPSVTSILTENGSNLSLILKNILEDKEKKRKLSIL